MIRHAYLARLALVAGIASATPATAQSAQSVPIPDSSFMHWARANAIPLRSVDQPYVDSSFDFLRVLVGNARILALGEPIHLGHEPLEFRNQVIRYAVTHLGFTAVALESGFTEGTIVDDFIGGEAGDIDSVLKNGITYQFGDLKENRELVLWLRDHNARAARKVHFYGVDLTSGAGEYTGASKAVLAALGYLEHVAPSASAGLKSRLVPMMSRFTTARYHEYSPAELDRLRTDLNGLYQMLLADSIGYARASSALRYARAARNAWTALRLDTDMADSSHYVRPSVNGVSNRVGISLRDLVMAENTRWALGQEGEAGRVVLFAANGHVMNAPVISPPGPAGTSWVMLGQYLRAWFGTSIVIVGVTTSRIVGLSPAQSDSSSFDAALAKVGLPRFVLDLRTGDRIPVVAGTLRSAWPFRLHTWFQPIILREAADAIVYFDRDTASKDHKDH